MIINPESAGIYPVPYCFLVRLRDSFFYDLGSKTTPLQIMIFYEFMMRYADNDSKALERP